MTAKFFSINLSFCGAIFKKIQPCMFIQFKRFVSISMYQMSFDMQNYKDSFGIENLARGRFSLLNLVSRIGLGDVFQSFTAELGPKNRSRGIFRSHTNIKKTPEQNARLGL